MDVSAWLRSLDLQRYEAAFRANGINSAVLPSVTASDLEELGVRLVGHRRKLLDAIAALRAGSAARDKAIEATPAPAPQGIVGLGERRQVAVVFADLAGYTRLSSELDAEDVHAILSDFFELSDRIVVDHGGAVDKHIGDCVMAVFGAPIARGNDAERAARAALAIRDAMPALVSALKRPLNVHVGVACGEVVARDVGGAYTVTGESVNLAARLTAAARPGEVLISAAMHQVLADRMDCVEAGTLQVKGFDAPVQTWRLGGPRPTKVAGAARPIVGRKHERRQFAAVLASCLESDRGQTVHISGDAGVGKTRLVEEFRRSATEVGFACHSALVLDFGSGAGRDAIGSLVRSLLGVPQSGTEDVLLEGLRAAIEGGLADADRAVFLHDLLALPLSSELRALADAMDNATRERGQHVTIELLIDRASAVRPVLLVIEDLHWADDATLRNVGAIAAAVHLRRAILVTTARHEGELLQRGWRMDRPIKVDLAPLPTDKSSELAGILLGETRSAFVARCVQRSGGNPLFLEQLIREAAEHLDSDAIPDTVQTLVQARLDRLDPALKQAAQAATIFGQRFSLGGLRHLVGDGFCDVSSLIKHHLIQRNGEELLFEHALIRDAVYASLLHSRRRELHRRAAAWFAEQGDPALRAEHLDRAQDPDAAGAYLEAAAARPRRYRYEAALAQVERGLVLTRDSGFRFALACKRGDLLHDLGRTRACPRRLRGGARDGAERGGAVAGRGSDLPRSSASRMISKGPSPTSEQAEQVASRLGLKVEAARVHFLRGNLLFPRGDIEGCLRQHRASLDVGT